MENIIHLAETDSTNQYLTQLLHTDRPKEGLIVRSDFQKAGKGQTGNSWESESGQNLTFSIVLYPDFIEAREQFIISQLVSLAIIDTLKLEIEDVSIKWPNDIYVSDKKIAGILIENVISGIHIESCIIGIGLNVNQERFTSTAPNPISLKQITKKNYNLEALLKDIRNNLFIRYMELLKGEESVLLLDYANFLYRKSGYHTYQTSGDYFEARIKSVYPSGHLILEDSDGKEYKFAFKEVKFIL